MSRMSDGGVVRPFRWDIRRRSQLGSLPDVDLPETYDWFEEELFQCTARVLAFAGDSDLVFVGRSPEPIFHALSGLLLGTSWDDRLRLLNVSLRWAQPTGEQLKALYPYLAEVGLDPPVLARRPRTAALVDVVDTGETFANLMEILHGWCERENAEWRAVARKLRIVGITWQEPTSPKTWRWQQQAEWVDRLRLHDIKNVAAPGQLATYLAADAPKTSPPFRPDAWGSEEAARPWRALEARQALALAVHLFDLGRTPVWRAWFAERLSEQPAIRERWFRSLALEIKR